MSLVYLLLLACSSNDEPLCREGTTLAEDGHCYPPLMEFPPQLDDAVAALPDCEPVDGSDDLPIDIARGCASGVCAGDTFDDMVAALGPIDCVTTTFDNQQVYCTWPELGIDALFVDDDRNSIPDPTRRTDRIRLFPPHAGATVDGVGIGANIRCFIDSLGNPERMNLVDVAGQLTIRDLLYDSFGLLAFDQGFDDDSSLPNGYVDNMYLYGN